VNTSLLTTIHNQSLLQGKDKMD